VIDSITKAVTEQDTRPDLIRFDESGTRRYELSTRINQGTYLSTFQAWPDGPGGTPLWSVEYHGFAGDVATGPDSVYVALNRGGGLVDIRRLDGATGAELGTTQKQPTDHFASAKAVHIFNERLFLGAANPQTLLPPLVQATQTLASFDALTLAVIATVDQEDDTSNIGPILFDTALSVGYVARLFCYRSTCWDNLTSFDPITLARTGNVMFAGTGGHQGRALGEVRNPGRAPAGSATFFAVAQTVLPEFFTRVPIGNWQARVRAVPAAASSPPCNVATIVSGACQAAPGTPFDLATVTGGAVVTLQWREPSTGAPAEYVIEAGSYAGLTDLARLTITGSRAAIQLTAPPGVYVVRVRAARTACGESAASNEIVVVMP
jgi:hypothetical protein